MLRMQELTNRRSYLPSRSLHSGGRQKINLYLRPIQWPLLCLKGWGSGDYLARFPFLGDLGEFAFCQCSHARFGRQRGVLTWLAEGNGPSRGLPSQGTVPLLATAAVFSPLGGSSQLLSPWLYLQRCYSKADDSHPNGH